MADRTRWGRVFAGTMGLAVTLMALPIGRAGAETAAPAVPKVAETSSAKTPAVPAEAKSGSPSGAPAKPESAPAAPPASSAETPKPDKAENTSRSKHRRRPGDAAAQDAKVGQGPSPASPPPLTMGGLREEMHREAAPVAIDPDAAPRTKVEQMLSEITKARQALHEDTVRLEGMMAQDGSESAPGGPGASGTAPAAGRPVAKNPLDVLAKALRGIKPDQAAPIVSRLDKRLAATVLQRMPPVDAGKILGAMKPDTAAELATQIAMRVMPSEVKR